MTFADSFNWGESFWLRVALVGAGAGVAAVTAVWAWRRFLGWRQKDPDEIERLRRLDVNRRGRITPAQVVDIIDVAAAGGDVPAPGSCLVVYKYEVAGVTYEVSQDVAKLPGVASAVHSLADQSASIKYDPKTPTNSIIVCEEWSGLDRRSGIQAPVTGEQRVLKTES